MNRKSVRGGMAIAVLAVSGLSAWTPGVAQAASSGCANRRPLPAQASAHLRPHLKPGQKPPAAVEGQDFEWQPLVLPCGSFSWSVAGGRLPDGLTLDRTTGRVSGWTPNPGTWRATIRVSSRAGHDQATYTFQVAIIDLPPPPPPPPTP